MSTLLTIIYLFQIFCEIKSDHPGFNNIQWITTLPETADVAADTFTVAKVSLISAHKELQIIPTITGLKNPSTILDNTSNTIAIGHTVNVTWNFNNTLAQVDYVRIVTNCGIKASLFCNNSILILTNSSTQYTQTATLTENMVNKGIHPEIIVEDSETTMILIITFVIVGVVLLIVLFVLWRNKLACFKQKPHVSTAIKGYPKTNSEQMRNKAVGVLFKQQT
eukprot:438339_1